LTLPLEDVPEGFKVGVAAADGGVADAEGGDVGLLTGKGG
jgi:hypothetical protein